MTNIVGWAASFAIASVIALLITPAVAGLSKRLGAIDYPDGRRKSQPGPVPRGGGVAIVIAAVFAVVVVALYVSPADRASSQWLMGGLLPAVAILLMVGLVDDFLSLTGIYKLIGQVFAVSVLVAAGAQFDRVSLFGLMFPLGDFRIPFTMFFCLGAVNAFNLIDGVDGLAASIGAIICATLGIIAGSQGHLGGSLVCFALAGGLVGFLRYNISPATVYLGDTGSMLIGLVVAAVAIDCSIKQQAAFVLAVPLAICAIPILDAGAALVRRVTTGQSVFTADRGHLHHALLLRGWSANKTVLIIAGLAGLTCAGALASYYTNHDFIALAVAAAVFAALAISRVFGHAEAALVLSRSKSIARALLSQGVRRPAPAIESSVQLQGQRKWQNLWVALRDAAPNYDVAGLTLQINIPQLHESFYANWKCDESELTGHAWRVTLPLMLEDRPIGKLSLVGASAGDQAVADMQQLFDYLEPLHSQIAQIVTGDDVPAKKVRAGAAMAPALN